MPRRLAGVIIGVIVLATFGYVIYASHVGQRGDHLLQEAETASNRGDYASAVRAFERLTTEYPNHAKIDEALYRLGFINRHFLNDPETALSAYERLVKVHGDSDSQWIQLAMQEIGDIHRSQQDYDKALEQYESIIAQFGDDPQIHAETALEIAHTWFEMGDAAQVASACREVLDLESGPNGSLERQHVEALQLMAQATLDLEGKPKEAVDVYQVLIQEYGHLPAIEESARKELAYIRSVYPDLAPQPKSGRPSGATTETRPVAPPPSGAVMVELPRNPVSDAGDTGMFDCLAVLCEAAGQVVSPTKLAGFSNQPFAFFYDSGRPVAGPQMAMHDPIITAAQRVGLPGSRMIESPSIDLALTNLKSQLHSGRAVLVPLALAGSPSWRIVRGYDAERGEFYLYSSSTRYQAVGGAEFRRAWQSPAAPAVILKGTNGPSHSMYVIAGPVEKCQVVSAVESSVADAIDLMRGDVRIGSQASGQVAFGDLADDLGGLADGTLSDTDARQLADWCGRPLDTYVTRRGEAADYLELWREAVFEPGSEQEHVSYAIELLEESAHLMDELGTAFRRAKEGTGPVEGGGSPQDIARTLADLEGRIADELSAAL